MTQFKDYDPEIIYGYSTRKGGVSKGIFESMNLSLSMPDDPANVKRNFEIWCDSLGVDPRDMVMVRQTHTANVIRVDEKNKGQGIYRERIEAVDGMVTNVPGIALVTSHADCVPVYLYDPVHRAIGLSHAGWRGTVAEIAGATVSKMTEEFGSVPEEMIAMIGPCICREHFECDRDVVDAVERMSIDGSEMVYYDPVKGKYHVSLAGLNRLVLEASGIPEDRIDMQDRCTYENTELYFSHRRQGRERGGQAALLMMRR